MDDIVVRLNVIEQEPDKYMEKEPNEEEATTKSNINTEKEPKEIKAWEGNESKGANITLNKNLTKLKQIKEVLMQMQQIRRIKIVPTKTTSTWNLSFSVSSVVMNVRTM